MRFALLLPSGNLLLLICKTHATFYRGVYSFPAGSGLGILLAASSLTLRPCRSPALLPARLVVARCLPLIPPRQVAAKPPPFSVCIYHSGLRPPKPSTLWPADWALCPASRFGLTANPPLFSGFGTGSWKQAAPPANCCRTKAYLWSGFLPLTGLNPPSPTAPTREPLSAPRSPPKESPQDPRTLKHHGCLPLSPPPLLSKVCPLLVTLAQQSPPKPSDPRRLF